MGIRRGSLSKNAQLSLVSLPCLPYCPSACRGQGVGELVMEPVRDSPALPTALCGCMVGRAHGKTVGVFLGRKLHEEGLPSYPMFTAEGMLPRPVGHAACRASRNSGRRALCVVPPAWAVEECGGSRVLRGVCGDPGYTLPGLGFKPSGLADPPGSDLFIVGHVWLGFKGRRQQTDFPHWIRPLLQLRPRNP